MNPLVAAILSVAASGHAQSTIESLAQRPGWRALLHVRVGDRLSDSQVLDPGFILTDTETSSLVDELRASLELLADGRLHCDWPARARWLCAERDWPGCRPETRCEELEHHRERFRAPKIYVGFGSYNATDPATLYGHTFLWFSPSRDHEPTSRGSVLAFQTDLSGLSPLEYAPLALAGLLRGRFQTSEFSERERVYRIEEQRDLWLFELKLTASERAFAVDHAFEVIGHELRYGLMRDNCALRLLEFLAVVRPSSPLSTLSVAILSPADSLKLLDKSGLLGAGFTRPSVWRSYLGLSANLTAEQKWQVAQLVAGEFNPASADTATLDVGLLHTELYNRYTTFRLARDGAGAFDSPRRRILLERMRRDEPAASITSRPRESPLDGHALSRVALGGGYNNVSRSFAELDLRIAMHDDSDPPSGYPRSIALSTGQVRLRHLFDREELWLEEAVLVRAGSRPNALEPGVPFSWSGFVDAQRLPLDPISSVLHAGAGAEFGLTTRFGRRSVITELSGNLGARVGTPIDEPASLSAVGYASADTRWVFGWASIGFGARYAVGTGLPESAGYAVSGRLIAAPSTQWALGLQTTQRPTDGEIMLTSSFYY